MQARTMPFHNVKMPANAPKWAYMRFFTLAYTLAWKKVIHPADKVMHNFGLI